MKQRGLLNTIEDEIKTKIRQTTQSALIAKEKTQSKEGTQKKAANITDNDLRDMLKLLTH